MIALGALHASLTLTPPITLGTAAWQLPSALAPGTGEQTTVGAVLSVTVKVVVQVALLPAASVAVTVIVFVPGPTSVPASGLWLTVTALVGLQLSLTLTPPSTFGTAAWQFASAKALGVAEQITVGAVLSVTTKLVVQVALLPAASVAVTVIVFVPRPTSVPAAGPWLRLIAPAAVQLSLTVTPPSTLGTSAWLHESGNLRAVLDRLQASGQTERVLWLAGALAEFWATKGHLFEGRRRLESALSADSRPTAARGSALIGAADLANGNGDPATGRLRAEEGLALHRTLGDTRGSARCLLLVGIAANLEGD